MPTPSPLERPGSWHSTNPTPARSTRANSAKASLFGYKAQVVDNPEAIIPDYSVHIGNPSDTGLLRPSIEQIVTLIGVLGW